MLNRKPASTALLAVALLGTIHAQPANAQWWKSLMQNQNQTPYPYQQPNPYQYQQNGGVNPNLSNVSDSMKNIERTADQLVKQSMFAPQGNDAGLMLSLSTLKDTARQARRAADSNDTNNLMLRLSQLQTISGNALTVAQRSGKNSYMIAQLQMIQSGVQQSMVFANTMPSMVAPVYGYNPYSPTPVTPMGFGGGVLQAAGNGRGQFSLMGQVLMGIKQATISCVDPVSRRATMTISQGGVVINLTGTLTSQTPNSATIALNGSDRGPATGIVTGVINSNGTLTSANGNGTLNGQPFALSFNGN